MLRDGIRLLRIDEMPPLMLRTVGAVLHLEQGAHPIPPIADEHIDLPDGELNLAHLVAVTQRVPRLEQDDLLQYPPGHRIQYAGAYALPFIRTQRQEPLVHLQGPHQHLCLDISHPRLEKHRRRIVLRPALGEYYHIAIRD